MKIYQTIISDMWFIENQYCFNIKDTQFFSGNPFVFCVDLDYGYNYIGEINE